VSRSPARHRKSSRSVPARSGAGRRRGEPSPIVSALPGKRVGVAAAAVAGSVLVVSAWPAAAHWMKQASRSAGAYQADARGLPAVGTGRGPAAQRAAGGRGRPAAEEAQAASQQPQLIKVAVASRRARHRKPPQAGPRTPDRSAYRNPLRRVAGLIPERVDQGVDFGGSGPVYALGDAVITSAADGISTGWPGGGWITYRLTDGPDAGLVVYLAEDVTPTVAVGQRVSPSTVIANMFAGADGIETGWASSTEFSAESQLPEAGGIGAGGPFPTRVGVNFDDLLQSLGAPAAPNVTQPAYGILPAGYPAN
jgi:hypothetical protein